MEDSTRIQDRRTAPSRSAPRRRRHLRLSAMAALAGLVILVMSACEQTPAPPDQPPPVEPPVKTVTGLIPDTQGFAAAVGVWNWKEIAADGTVTEPVAPQTALLVGFRFIGATPELVSYSFAGSGWNGDAVLSRDYFKMENPNNGYPVPQPEDTWRYVLDDTAAPTGGITASADAVSAAGTPDEAHQPYQVSVTPAGTPLLPTDDITATLNAGGDELTVGWAAVAGAKAYSVTALVKVDASTVRVLGRTEVDASTLSAVLALSEAPTASYLVTVEAFSTDLVVVNSDPHLAVDPGAAGFNASTTAKSFTVSAMPTP